MRTIRTVNYHITRRCNFKCKYCFAHFNGKHVKESLSVKDQKELVKQIATCGYFERINFAGGEPMLDNNLSELLQIVKEEGLKTSIITNGSQLTSEWIGKNADYIDIIGISIDSIDENANKRIGRYSKIGENFYNMISIVHENGIKLKINTTVNAFNKNDTLTPFINTIRPFRWKVFQTTLIEGENSEEFNKISVTEESFNAFCEKNRKALLQDIEMIKEQSDEMISSYCMIDPLGRFFNNANNKLSFSEPILTVGIETAYQMMKYEYEKFKKRGGDYIF